MYVTLHARLHLTYLQAWFHLIYSPSQNPLDIRICVPTVSASVCRLVVGSPQWVQDYSILVPRTDYDSDNRCICRRLESPSRSTLDTSSLVTPGSFTPHRCVELQATHLPTRCLCPPSRTRWYKILHTAPSPYFSWRSREVEDCPNCARRLCSYGIYAFIMMFPWRPFTIQD